MSYNVYMDRSLCGFTLAMLNSCGGKLVVEETDPEMKGKREECEALNILWPL
jgi:hypothetical protein